MPKAFRPYRLVYCEVNVADISHSDGWGWERRWQLVCLDGPSWAVYYWLKVNQYMATSAFIMSLAQESCQLISDSACRRCLLIILLPVNCWLVCHMLVPVLSNSKCAGGGGGIQALVVCSWRWFIYMYNYVYLCIGFYLHTCSYIHVFSFNYEILLIIVDYCSTWCSCLSVGKHILMRSHSRCDMNFLFGNC